MVFGDGTERALTVDDLPRIVADVSRSEPERVAFRTGDQLVTYGQLDALLQQLDAAMGGALGPESLVPLVLADLVPEMLGADGALDRIVADVLSDATDTLGADTPRADTPRADTFGADTAETTPAGSPETLVDAFEASVDRNPDAVALVFDDQTLTYAELDRRANRVARYLVAAGVGPDRTVALALRRSMNLVVGMYGIIKAGGAYVPLDPDHPRERLAYIIGVADPVLVLTDAETGVADVLPGTVAVRDIGAIDDEIDDARLRPTERATRLRPGNTAYVIFTSGSTGKPKGVAVSHSAVQANLAWRQRQYSLGDSDLVLQKTPFTFDVSVWEFFWPLQVGARLLIARPDGHHDPGYLAWSIRTAGVTVVHFVPSMLAVFVDAPDTRGLPSLRYVFASGEELTAATTARFAAGSDAQLHNLYGPTEAAIDVTHHRAELDGAELGSSIPIGTAVDGTELYVLGHALEPVPPNTVGELYIAGIQLAREYVRSPARTAERFVADPYAVGTRMYRTGDLVRRSDNGDLTYLGRSDFQVKLRGLRIELGEIETLLRQQYS